MFSTWASESAAAGGTARGTRGPWNATAGCGRVVKLLLASLALGAWAADPGVVSGQEADSVPAAYAPDAPYASAFVPPDHWAERAVRRLEVLGLAGPGFSWNRGTLTQGSVARILRDAERTAQESAPQWLPLLRGYAARFAEEFPAAVRAAAGREAPGARLADARLALGLERRTGEVLAGAGYFNDHDWSGPRTRPDQAGLAAVGSWSGELFPFVSVTATPSVRYGDWSLEAGYALAAWRDVAVWAGRRALGYGPGVGGGIVLNGAVQFDGGGVLLIDPVTLPGLLGVLGPIRFDTFVSRMDRNGEILNPWVWAARTSIAPHPRLGIGLSRAAVFGGAGNATPTLRNLVYVIIGKHGGKGSEFDNHVVAVDVRYRPPLADLPLALYLEWGFEDSAGAWRDVPGTLFGVELAALPGLPQVGFGLERASFAPSCCGNPIWYRHWHFLDGWTESGAPLGHPLGGHGTEWLGYGYADLLDARLRLTGRAFVRNREAENLFAPDRAGRSTGGSFQAAFRAAPRIDVLFGAELESGENDWTESRLGVGVRGTF